MTEKTPGPIASPFDKNRSIDRAPHGDSERGGSGLRRTRHAQDRL